MRRLGCLGILVLCFFITPPTAYADGVPASASVEARTKYVLGDGVVFHSGPVLVGNLTVPLKETGGYLGITNVSGDRFTGENDFTFGFSRALGVSGKFEVGFTYLDLAPVIDVRAGDYFNPFLALSTSAGYYSIFMREEVRSPNDGGWGHVRNRLIVGGGRNFYLSGFGDLSGDFADQASLLLQTGGVAVARYSASLSWKLTQEVSWGPNLAVFIPLGSSGRSTEVVGSLRVTLTPAK